MSFYIFVVVRKDVKIPCFFKTL